VQQIGQGAGLVVQTFVFARVVAVDIGVVHALFEGDFKSAVWLLCRRVS
jgi:hypothetical protein